MSERPFHPNAYIPSMRNRKAGLRARSLVLNILSKKSISSKELLSETKLSYSSLRYHLRVLEKHRLIKRKVLSKKEVIIEQTGLGQQPIT